MSMQNAEIDPRDRHNRLFYCTLAYLIVFYSQLGGRIPALGKIRIELLIGAVLLASIVTQIAAGNIRLGSNKVIKAAGLFFLSVLCSLPAPIVNHTTSEAIEAIIRLAKFAAIFLMIIATVDTKRKLKIFVYFYVGCISFIIVESFFNGLHGLNFHPVDHVMRLHGPTGLFRHPNSLGGVTAGVLPFLYYLFFYERRIWRKILIIVIALMAARVIIWTGSRTAWVGTLALLGFIWWYSKRKVALALCGVVLLVTAWMAMPPVMKARFLTLGETVKVVEEKEQVSSMSTRWTLMKDEWGVFLKYPITGVGINSFPQARLRIYKRWQPHHNTYLQALADLGIIGFSAFAYLIYTIWLNLRQAAARGDPENDDPFITTMTLILWVFLLTRLTVGMFGGDLYENYWWIAGGLSIVLLNIAREQPDEPDADDEVEQQKVPTHEPDAGKPKRPRWKSTFVQ